MARIIHSAVVTQLTLFAIFIAKTIGAGVTFLAVCRAIAHNKAGTAVFTGCIIFQMANKTGRAALVAGTAAAVLEASEAQLAQFCVAIAGAAVLTMAARSTVKTLLTFAAPLIKAVVALKATNAEVAHLEQTVFTFLAVCALVIGALMALFTFRAVLSTFGAFAALLAVLTVVKLFLTALAIRADLAASVAIIALFAGLAPCIGTSGTDLSTLIADIFIALARTTSQAMVSLYHGTVDAHGADIAVDGAILAERTFGAEIYVHLAIQTTRAMHGILYRTAYAHLAIVAEIDALLTQPAIRAHHEFIFTFAAVGAVIVGLNAAVDAHKVMIRADITAVTANLAAFNADVKFKPAVAAVSAVVTAIKCTLVAQVAVLAPAVFLAVYTQTAVIAIIILVRAAGVAALAVRTIVYCTFHAHIVALAVFHAVGTPSASLADLYICLALAAVTAVIAVRDTAIVTLVTAHIAQFFRVVHALAAVGAVVLVITASAAVGAAMGATIADVLISAAFTAEFTFYIFVPCFSVDVIVIVVQCHREHSDDHNNRNQNAYDLFN